MKKIYLIDGNNFIYRMFYGLPEFATKDGKIVNAIFGMAKFFVKQLVKEKPDYVFFIKDAKGKNFRHDLYEDYKSTRDRMPDNLKCQIGDIEKMIKMMGIDIIEKEGYEADDVIGTLATSLGKDQHNDIYILTGDKDLYSLVTKNVKIYDTMKKRVFDIEKTIEKFGIVPERIIDYLAIVGDKSDNIPGIDGFGPQKAVGLINKIGGIDEIYLEAEKIETEEKDFKDFDKSIASCFKGKTFEKLINSKDNAFLSKKLATIDLSVDLHDFHIDEYMFHGEKLINDNIREYFKSLEFFSLISEEEQKLKTWNDLKLNVKIIQNKSELDNLFKKILNFKEITLDTETTSLNIIDAKLVGISIYLNDDNIFYINRLHKGNRILDKDLKIFLDNLFELDVLIIGHNLKYDLEIIELFKKNIEIKSDNDNNLGQMSFEI